MQNFESMPRPEIILVADTVARAVSYTHLTLPTTSRV